MKPLKQYVVVDLIYSEVKKLSRVEEMLKTPEELKALADTPKKVVGGKITQVGPDVILLAVGDVVYFNQHLIKTNTQGEKFALVSEQTVIAMD